MLCRTNKITHRGTGVTLETPLLVPSFSSKGFSRSSTTGESKDDEYVSGLHRQYEAAGEFITEAALVSAFDISHGYLPTPPKLGNFAELLFLDSGGYEVSDYLDLSDVEESIPKNEKWTQPQYAKVLAAWPKDLATAIVSYDHPKERLALEVQITEAKTLFSSHKHHLQIFLLKPETEAQSTLKETLPKVFANPAALKSFDIVGVTERELGSSPGTRMHNLALLRRALDSVDLSTVPIHVFGALDPLSATLYFMSGAEIFDGLTWLRYAYADGRCIYTHNHGPVALGLDESDRGVRVLTQVGNLRMLARIGVMLREFQHTQKFDKLTKLGAWDGAERFFQDAYESLQTKLKDKGG